MCVGELGGAVPLAVQQLCEPGLPLPHVRGAQDGEGIHRLHTAHGNVFILALQVPVHKGSLFTDSFIYTLIHSYVGSIIKSMFIRAFVCSFIHSFNNLISHRLMYRIKNIFVRSFIHTSILESFAIIYLCAVLASSR
jgi:hypothetical protein